MKTARTARTAVVICACALLFLGGCGAGELEIDAATSSPTTEPTATTTTTPAEPTATAEAEEPTPTAAAEPTATVEDVETPNVGVESSQRFELEVIISLPPSSLRPEGIALVPVGRPPLQVASVGSGKELVRHRQMVGVDVEYVFVAAGRDVADPYVPDVVVADPLVPNPDLPFVHVVLGDQAEASTIDLYATREEMESAAYALIPDLRLVPESGELLELPDGGTIYGGSEGEHAKALADEADAERNDVESSSATELGVPVFEDSGAADIVDAVADAEASSGEAEESSEAHSDAEVQNSSAATEGGGSGSVDVDDTAYVGDSGGSGDAGVADSADPAAEPSVDDAPSGYGSASLDDDAGQ